MDEDLIFATTSPVTGPGSFDGTARKRMLSYLLTGVGDKKLAGGEDDVIQRAQAWAKIELLTELLQWGIVKKATEWSADLIVVGAQSHSLLERFFLGSVSHKVAAEAPCSVRIGRYHRATDELRIIVGVDGSIDSKAALQEIASRTWRAGSHFRLVVVVDPHIETAMSWPGFLPENFVQTNDESGREWISRMAEAASRILFTAGLDVSNDIYDGNPKEVLVRVSEEWKADAIFLGARGLNHGNRLSLGTVTSSVASHAHCSVELVRPPRA